MIARTLRSPALAAALLAGCTVDAVEPGAGLNESGDTLAIDQDQVPVVSDCQPGEFVRRGADGWECVVAPSGPHTHPWGDISDIPDSATPGAQCDPGEVVSGVDVAAGTVACVPGGGDSGPWIAGGDEIYYPGNVLLNGGNVA